METKEIMFEKIKNEIRDTAVHGSEEASGSFNLLFEFLYEDIIKISKKTISSFSKCMIDFEDLAHETFLSVYRKIIIFISNSAEFQYINALGYIKKTAVNIVLKKIKNSDNLSIDDIPEGVTACAEETYDKLPLNNLIILKRESDVKVKVYSRAMGVVLNSRLKPYTIMGFAFNRLIYPFVIVWLRESLRTSEMFDRYFIDAKSIGYSSDELKKYKDSHGEELLKTINKLLINTINSDSDDDQVAEEARKLIFNNSVEKATCPKFTALVIKNKTIETGYTEMKNFMIKLHKVKETEFEKIKSSIINEDISSNVFSEFFGSKTAINVICEWTRKGNKILLDAQEKIVAEMVESEGEDK